MKFRKLHWLLVLFLVAVPIFLSVSCSKRVVQTNNEEVNYYVCPMHPSVKSQDPKAKCPICGMDLVPVKKKTTTESFGESTTSEMTNETTKVETHVHEEKPGLLYVPVERQQQIGVTYAPAKRKSITHTMRSVGTVTFDKQRHWDIVSRVEGYVDKLYVSSPGEIVDKNEPLLRIYSPDLFTTQRELVSLLQMRDEAQKSGSASAIRSAERLVDSAKNRLRLWNISERQIQELERTRQPTEELILHSPVRGIVQEIPVDQGRKVVSGDHLIDVADLSIVWVWAEFYQDELPMIKRGLPVSITTSSYPREIFRGTIAVIDPMINESTRTARVRIDIENSALKLRPAMYLNVEVSMDMGEALTVPVGAVLPTGKHNIVFVDKTAGHLEPRFIELGRKYNDVYVVESGLEEGERVVTSANFLIDAEAKIQGALESW